MGHIAWVCARPLLEFHSVVENQILLSHAWTRSTFIGIGRVKSKMAMWISCNVKYYVQLIYWIFAHLKIGLPLPLKFKIKSGCVPACDDVVYGTTRCTEQSFQWGWSHRTVSSHQFPELCWPFWGQSRMTNDQAPEQNHNNSIQGDHLSGKPRNVGEFGTCQGNVRDVVNSHLH